MDIRNLCSSGSRSCRTIQLGKCYEEIKPVSSPSSRSSNKLRWKVFWMKFKKEKRRIFEPPAPVQIPYDSYAYSQNFDQGSEWDEPDNLSRSFSARFADYSRIFQKEETV